MFISVVFNKWCMLGKHLVVTKPWFVLCKSNFWVYVKLPLIGGPMARAVALRGPFWPLIEFDPGSPSFNFSASLVNSQLVCLRPVGIYKSCCSVLSQFTFHWPWKSPMGCCQLSMYVRTKWHMKWIIYWTADIWNQVKLWSSQFNIWFIAFIISFVDSLIMHENILIHKWPPNISGFTAQLVRYVALASRGHGFKPRWSLEFFRLHYAIAKNCVHNWIIASLDYVCMYRLGLQIWQKKPFKNSK